MDSFGIRNKKEVDGDVWEAAGAPREPRNSGPEEPVSIIVYVPSTPTGKAGSLFRCSGLPARSQLSVYLAWSMLPGSKGSQQEQQGLTTGTRQAGQCPRHPGGLQCSNSLPKLPGTESLHRRRFYGRPGSVQQTRDSTRKLGNCGSSPGIAGILRVQRSPTVYVVLHLHLYLAWWVGALTTGSGIPAGRCSKFQDADPEFISASNKGSKQDL